MPRPGPRRKATAVRMSDEQTAAAKQRATEEGLLMKRGDPNVSEWLRIAELYARTHMPPGWRSPE